MTNPGLAIAVLGATGGCGKTTFATNLAFAVASPMRRVCLLDLGLGSRDVIAGLDTNGAVPRPLDPSPRGLGLLVSPIGSSVDCVFAPVPPDSVDRPARSVDTVMTVLADRYDVVVVDTPTALNRDVIEVLERTEKHVLLTTPERPALERLHSLLDSLDLLGLPRSSRVVVLNRSSAGDADDQALADCISRAPVAAHIPSSADVPASINGGRPLVIADPDHPVSTAIKQFSENFLGIGRESHSDSAITPGGSR